MLANIKDVAKLAGVSPATVSRVLTQNARTSEKTYEKVKKAMEQLNYTPNFNAQSLSSSRNGTVCFTIAAASREVFGDPFFNDLLQGISDVVEAEELSLQLSVSQSVDEQIKKCLKLYHQKKVDGFILSTAEDALIDSLQQEHIPFVVIGRSLKHHVFSIHNDNVQMAYLTTKHLIDAGYRRVIYLNGPMRLRVSFDRVSGYQQALMEYGIPYEEQLIITDDLSQGKLYDVLNKTLNKTRFDAVIAADSMMAINVLNYCQRNQIKVPDEVGIIGFNDSPLMEQIYPSISGVEVLSRKLGAEAMDLFLEVLQAPGQPKKNIILPCEIIARDTTRR